MIVACKFGLEQGMLECVLHTCIHTYIAVRGAWD